MKPNLHIQLLGELQLIYDHEPVLTVDTPRLQSLLAYLVLHHGVAQARPYIAFSFWPDSTEKQALTNLRHLLHDLRQTLPDSDHFIRADSKILTWRHDATYTLDVNAFRQAIASAEEAIQRAAFSGARMALEGAVEWYQGDLLPSCYDEWIEPERERLRQEYEQALERLVRLLEDRRDYKHAIRYARLLQWHEPLRESTYRTLMRLYASCGDRAGALRVYQDCADVMQREFDTKPSAPTVDLHERLIDGSGPPDAPQNLPPWRRTAELPLVGRHEEWSRLKELWERSARGQAHLVVITGEAGIGKTRLSEELLTWAGRQGITTAQTRSYAAEGRLAYAPIADWLRTEVIRANLSRLDRIWLAEVARLLPDLKADYPQLPQPAPLNKEWQRSRLFEALSRALLAGGAPMVLLLDDMQWTDQATLHWLRYLLRFAPEAQLLIAGTIRIEEMEPEGSLHDLLLDLRQNDQAAEIPLRSLDASETAELAAHMTGRELPPVSAAHLHGETEGNPLFVVESIRAGLQEEQALPDMRESTGIPDPVPLPPKVQAVITGRLEQLSPAAREVAGIAAVIGHAFTDAVLAQVSDRTDEGLATILDELWHRRIIREQHAGHYDFTHDKLREGAYANLRPANRRLLHQKIAQTLETLHASDLRSISGELAVHYEQAGRLEQAIEYYKQAAEEARHMYANEDALGYLSNAQKLLARSGGGHLRGDSELSLLLSMGPCLITTRGYASPEVGTAYSRAQKLCERTGKMERLPPVLWGLWTFYLVRGRMDEARKIGKEFQELAQVDNNPAHLVASHFCQGSSLFHMGELRRARTHLEEALSCYTPRHHIAHVLAFGPDPGVFCLAYTAHTLWHLGYPDQALQASRQALDQAYDLSDSFSQAIALDYTAMLHQFRREPDLALDHANRAVALCSKHGFPYYHAWGTILQGWARAFQGEISSGIQAMHEGINALQDAGAMLRHSYYTGLLAETYEKAGHAKRGLAMLNEALSTRSNSGECLDNAEMYRLQGSLLLKQAGSGAHAEDLFQQSLIIARNQGARSMELRTAISLGRLWQNQNKARDARRLLQEVYDRLTEGFDTHDLKQARALMDALALVR